MSLTLTQQYLTEHTEPTEKDNLMNPSAASYLHIYGRRSSRQGCNPVGESPTVSVARVGHVVMPHLGAGNQPSYAWCKRPGRPEDLVLQRWVQPGGLTSVGA